MFEIVTYSSGKREAFDLHKIALPDGTKAFGLDQADLFQRMKALGVPGAEVTTGKQELIICLGRWIAANAVDPVTGRLADGTKKTQERPA